MDIKTLKLELVQQLVALNDASILSSTKRFVDFLVSKSAPVKEDDDQAMMAAAAMFGSNAYGDDEPDISDLELKEPNPNYGG